MAACGPGEVSLLDDVGSSQRAVGPQVLGLAVNLGHSVALLIPERGRPRGRQSPCVGGITAWNLGHVGTSNFVLVGFNPGHYLNGLRFQTSVQYGSSLISLIAGCTKVRGRRRLPITLGQH